MIERIYDKSDSAFLRLHAENGFDARMLAYLDAYGTNYDFCRFYKADGALLLDYEGEVMLTADKSADGEELALYIKMNKIFSAELNKTAYKLVKPFVDKSFLVLKIAVMISRRSKDGGEEIVFTENYKEVHDIISDAFGTDSSSYDRWYADNNHRVRHGVSKLAVVYINDEPAATCTVFYDNELCFLSHIGVKKRFQGQGIGRRLVNTICAKADKPVLLECKRDRIRFYKKCGFKRCGTAYALIPLN